MEIAPSVQAVRAARKIIKAKEMIRELCDTIEDCYEELLEHATEGDQFVHGGKVYALKDNYRDQNTAFRSHCIQRFELVEVKT